MPTSRFPQPRPIRNTRPARLRSQRQGGLGPVSAVGAGPKPGPQGFQQPKPAGSPLIAPNAPKMLPPDPGYEKQVGSINANETSTIAGLRGQRTRTLQDYGYTAQFDGNDKLVAGSLQFDPTNVFSRAALLLKTYRQNRAGNTNGLAAQGQLNSGAYGRQQRLINFNESAAQDAQQRGLIDFLARNQGDITKAGTDAEFNRGEAESARIDRAPDNPLYDSTSPGGTAPKPGGQYDALGRLITAAGNGRPSIVYDAKKGGSWHIYPDGRKVFVKKK